MCDAALVKQAVQGAKRPVSYGVREKKKQVEAMASICLVDLLYSQISKRNVLSNNIQVNHHVV